MTIKKQCKYCGADFDGRHPKAEFCKSSHRNAWWKKNASQSEKPSLSKPTALRGVEKPDDFLVNLWKEEISSLKNENKELRLENDKQLAARRELEEQLNAKPTGLGSIGQALSNPEIMGAVAPILQGIAQKFLTPSEPEPIHPILQWMNSLPLNAQQEFNQVIKLMMQLQPDMLTPNLVMWKNSLSRNALSRKIGVGR